MTKKLQANLLARAVVNSLASTRIRGFSKKNA